MKEENALICRHLGQSPEVAIHTTMYYLYCAIFETRLPSKGALEVALPCRLATRPVWMGSRSHFGDG